jgi:hypothetical protein
MLFTQHVTRLRGEGLDVSFPSRFGRPKGAGAKLAIGAAAFANPACVQIPLVSGQLLSTDFPAYVNQITIAHV